MAPLEGPFIAAPLASTAVPLPDPPSPPAEEPPSPREESHGPREEPPGPREELVPARDSVVPRGTFASEGPPEDTTANERKETPSRRMRVARDMRHEGRDEHAHGEAQTAARSDEPRPQTPAVKAQASSQRLRVARSPERPPFLASEILREDLAPKDPGTRLAAGVIGSFSAVGLASMLAGGIETTSAIGLAAVFAALFALGRWQLPYFMRAALVALLSGAALLFVSWQRLATGAPARDLLLTVTTTLLPAALYARDWYRGSVAARLAVGAALLPALSWAFATGHRQLLSLAFEWNSWLPALTWYVFVIFCLLALLAFMGSETTGGCAAWALGLGIWYALYAGVRYALEQDASVATRALGLAEPALAAPLAVALAQLWSLALCARSRRSQLPASGTGVT